VESEPELQRINEVAISLNLQASVAIRINPDVDPRTHPYIATGLRGDKFGVPFEDALALYQKASKMSGICLTGIACHIGSQLTEVAPFCDALQRVLDVVDELHKVGIHLTHLDLGGGLGIRYSTENPPAPQQYIQALIDVLKTRECNMHVTLEPGRAIVGNAGVLLTKVEYIKKGPEKNFAIVDAAMNDLIRPALYEAWHDVVEVNKTVNRDSRKCDVVGPVCESGDFLARDRMLAIGQDDLVAVRSAGAYGFVMSSNYNARPRAAEVMVDGDAFHVIRERESTASLFSGEHLLR
jgi:diaminopimelate decarboxylase